MTIEEAIEYWEQFNAEIDDLYDACSDAEMDVLVKQREIVEYTISALRKQEQQPNAPLTLDELRKMDGEPVWVRSLDGNGKDIWAFVDTDCEMARIFVTRFSVKCMVTLRHFKAYGKTWLAYRQKPEEETT